MTSPRFRWLLGLLLLVGCGAPPVSPPQAFELRPAQRYVEAYPYGSSTLGLSVQGGDPGDPVELHARGLPTGMTMRADSEQLTFVSTALEPGAFDVTLVGVSRAFVREVPLRVFVPTRGPLVQEGERRVDVTVKSEFENAVSVQVSPTGAQGSVTASDGTRYTVTLPLGAVHESTVIRLTPVTGVDWAGFTTARGVRIDPDTLQLWRAARVDVSFPGKPNGSGVFRAFGADVNGEHLFLRDVVVRDLQASFVLSRAGIGGVGWVTIDALAEPPLPRRPEDRRSERLARFSTPNEARITELTYDATLSGRLPRSGVDERVVSELLREVALWSADVREGRWAASFAGNVGLKWAQLAEVAVGHAARYRASCGGAGEEGEALRAEIARWHRAASFLPEWADALGAEGVRELDDALEACR